jgi:glycosyltransferase involved in cell wall biosynthesis
MSPEPFVSVLAPVYNGEPFIAECIESILAQDYTNWEYIIVNNCSTDGTLAVVERYARKNPKIRVVTNQRFVDCEQNHNNAFRLISNESRYCKVVSADDRLMPGALGKMVRFAVQNPSVGIVGSYQQSGDSVKWKGLPEGVTVLSGREACRMGLLASVHLFGNPTSVLYRADLVRRTESFFPHSEPHADTSACYAHLHDCDFGFIHEVLSVERVHEGRLTARVDRLDAGTLAYIDILMQYGPMYLGEAELRTRLDQTFADYYRWLGGCMLKLKGREFWEFHRAGLGRLGYALDWRRILMEALREFASELRRPMVAWDKFRHHLREEFAPEPGPEPSRKRGQ